MIIMIIIIIIIIIIIFNYSSNITYIKKKTIYIYNYLNLIISKKNYENIEDCGTRLAKSKTWAKDLYFKR
jgi:hypothetical protein